MGPVPTSVTTHALLVVSSIVVSVAMSAGFSRLFRGTVALDYLVTGFFVSAVVSTAVVLLVARYERRLALAHRDVLALSAELAERNTELRETAARAEALAATRTRFLATMSHEIRTPLAGLVGVAHLLEETDLDADQRRLVQTQLQSSRWLRQVVDGVLDLSRMEAGPVEYPTEPTELRRLLRGVLRGMAPLADERDLRLRLEAPDDLPAWVRCPPVRLEQALLNLLANAIRCSDEGEVLLRARRVDELLRFEVLDRGIGFDPDKAGLLFEPYYSVGAHGGAGLGLPLVRAFAHDHGGEAGASPREGGGSVFWFTVRLPPTSPAPVDGNETPSAPAGGLRVLLAENSPVNRMVLLRMLEHQGHAVRAVSNGADALTALAEEPFDLVLMDNDMPLLDGCAATRAIRADPSLTAVAVVGVTAAVLPEDLQRCTDSGMDRVLRKPVLPEDLREATDWVHARLAAS